MNIPTSPGGLPGTPSFPIDYDKVGTLRSFQSNDGSITLSQEVMMKLSDGTERTIVIDMNMDMNSFNELKDKGNLDKQILFTINKMVGLALIYDLGKKTKAIDLENHEILTVEKIDRAGKSGINKIKKVKLTEELKRKHAALAKKHKKRIDRLPQDSNEKEKHIREHPNEIQQLISLKTRIELLPHILKNTVSRKEAADGKQDLPVNRFHTHAHTKEEED